MKHSSLPIITVLLPTPPASLHAASAGVAACRLYCPSSFGFPPLSAETV